MKHRWKRLNRIFEEAVDRSPEELEPFLRRACGDDEQLVSDVRELVEASREAGEFLEDPFLGSTVRSISSSTFRALVDRDED